MDKPVQWFPGHMAKARRQIGEALALVDAVIEVCDARLPESSRNQDLAGWLGGKPRLLILSKTDLADPAATKLWCAHLAHAGQRAVAVDARSSAGKVRGALEQAVAPIVERSARRGMNKTVRALVVGTPNTGKSTLINALKGRAAAQTADRPGVTRGQQWVSAGTYLELLDTPGILPPKIADEAAGVRLALLGFVRDAILDQETLACRLMETLRDLAPEALADRCKIAAPQGGGEALLEQACLGRGFLVSGGKPDTARGAAVFLDEFRSGRMGRLTLELPLDETGGLATNPSDNSSWEGPA